MNAFISFIEKKVAPVANKIGRQTYIQAITSTFMTMIPLMTIGSFALIIISPSMDYTTMDPGILRSFFQGWQALADFTHGPLSAAYKGTMGALSLYIAIGLSYYLARAYKMSTFLPIALSAVTFIIVNAIGMDGALSTKYFEGTGLFAAIFIAIATFELYRFLYNKKVGRIDFGDIGIPPVLSESFASLIPMAIVVLVMSLFSVTIMNLSGDVFPNLMAILMEPVIGSVDSIWGIAIIAVLVSLFWWFGIHDSVIMGPMNTVFISNLTANMNAYAAGTAAVMLPFIASRPFWFTFVAIGGSGATFSLCLLCLRSKSKQIKTIGKLAIIPAFFNINEPIIFGLPIMFNPMFFIPFIGTMAMNGIITYLCMDFGIVAKPFADPTWNMFAPIAALIGTMDFKAVILVLLLIAMDMLIYLPFFKTYEKQKVEEELNNHNDDLLEEE